MRVIHTMDKGAKTAVKLDQNNFPIVLNDALGRRVIDIETGMKREGRPK